jgi:hypothetical protein
MVKILCVWCLCRCLKDISIILIQKLVETLEGMNGLSQVDVKPYDDINKHPETTCAADIRHISFGGANQERQISKIYQGAPNQSLLLAAVTFLLHRHNTTHTNITSPVNSPVNTQIIQITRQITHPRTSASKVLRHQYSRTMESYLEPGFDPNSLKVAELRGVLLKHDVDYPSSAKKSLLVELFNQHIVPEAARLRSANTLVQPSSHGMIDAGFTPEKSVLDPTPRRNRRSTRGLTAELTTEDDDERNFLKSTTARTPRKRAADGESASNENIPPPPSTARRTRKSMAIQPDENPAEADNFADEISPTVQDVPFSSFNPFQKGSPSPPFDARSPYKDRRKVGINFFLTD